MTSDNRLGESLKLIRKSKGITQLDLELLINSAPGHISRIESGSINPTKDTLIKIAKALNLTQKDENILLGLDPYRLPTEEEIRAAIEDARLYLYNCKTPAYLSDVFWFLYDANPVILGILGLGDKKEKVLTEYKGSHLLDWMFSPDLPFRQHMPDDEYSELMEN